MPKQPPEKLAAALRANLKRRKQQSLPPEDVSTGKDPEKIKENSLTERPRSSRGT
jgi:hypothetical protein